MNCICATQEVRYEAVRQYLLLDQLYSWKTRHVSGHANLPSDFYIRSIRLDQLYTGAAFKCAFKAMQHALRSPLLVHQGLATAVRMGFILPNQLSKIKCLTEAPVVLSTVNIEK